MPHTVQTLERFRGGNPGREFQPLDVDHLPLHRNRHRHAEHRQKEHPRRQQAIANMHAVDQHISGNGGDNRAAGAVSRRRSRGLHRIVFQDRHIRLDPARKSLAQRFPNRKTEDAGRDRDSQTPSGFQSDVEILQGQERAEKRAHDNGTPCELRHIVATINVFVPFALEFFRS